MAKQKLNLNEKLFRPIAVVDVDTPIAEVARIMSSLKIRHLPVVKDDEIVGIMSDRDVKRATQVTIHDWKDTTLQVMDFDQSQVASQFMSCPVKSIDANTPLEEVVQKIIGEKISALLITQRGQISGIVTTEDLLRLLTSEKKENEVSGDMLEQPQIPFSDFLNGLSSSGI